MVVVSKLAYVKSGDVVSEALWLTTREGLARTRGQDVFAAAVVRLAGKRPVQLLSIANRNASFRLGTLQAATINERWKILDWRLGRLRRDYCRFLLRRRLMSFKPGMIVCSALGPQLEAAFAASRQLGVPMIASIHNEVREASDLSLLASADRVLCHGLFLRDQALAIGHSADHVFPFHTEPLTISNFPVEPLSVPPRILYVGRIDRMKGVFDLLEAATPLITRGLVELAYIGDGPALAELRERAMHPHLRNRILIPGSVAHEDVASQIAGSLCVVVPTRREFAEGLCMAATESLDIGVPVIAPRSGPFTSYLRHGVNGLLYEPDSVVELRARLEEVATQPDLAASLRSGAAQIGSGPLRQLPLFDLALRHAVSSLGAA